MATVTLSGQSFSCTRAVKGTDSITLYEGDSPYLCVAGISDFSDVTIEGGEWETPEPTLQERLSVLESELLSLRAAQMQTLSKLSTLTAALPESMRAVLPKDEA